MSSSASRWHTGSTIAIMASAVGHISGGHFNPAVTLGFLVTRRIAPALAVFYWVAQLAGAVLGALALRAIFPSEANLDTGVPVVNSTINLGSRVVVARGILTFFLVWVVFATAADPGGAFKSIAGLAIGLTITVGVLAAGPLTGAAMNPARALGPELVFNVWDDCWVYLVGPPVGAVARARLRLALPAGSPAAGRRHARVGRRRTASRRRAPRPSRRGIGLVDHGA